jgi:hypothetical protein
MRLAWRFVVVCVVFVVVGWITATAVVAHAANGGTTESQIRLAGAMAGLFAGGAAATLAGIVLVATRRDRD